MSVSEIRREFYASRPFPALVLGMCPAAAVAHDGPSALAMGLAVAAVLCGTSATVSLFRKAIPTTVHSAFIVTTAAFYAACAGRLCGILAPGSGGTLGLSVLIISVNCLVMIRARRFAMKFGVWRSLFDGMVIGAIFCGVLVVIGTIRELIGAATVWGRKMPGNWEGIGVVGYAPGAFFALAALAAFINVIREKKGLPPL